MRDFSIGEIEGELVFDRRYLSIGWVASTASAYRPQSVQQPNYLIEVQHYDGVQLYWKEELRSMRQFFTRYPYSIFKTALLGYLLE